MEQGCSVSGGGNLLSWRRKKTYPALLVSENALHEQDKHTHTHAHAHRYNGSRPLTTSQFVKEWTSYTQNALFVGGTVQYVQYTYIRMYIMYIRK